MNIEKPNWLVRLLPSLTDAAFLMPIVFLFTRLSGGHYLLSDGDTGWHIRTGEWILQNGRVPDKDIFSFTKSGEPWFAWEWLWDVIFAWLHQHAGMEAVVLASLLVLCCTFTLLFRLVKRNCPNVLLAFGVTLCATAGSSMHWLARPHLFTLLFVVIFLSILERVREGRAYLLLSLPALMLLWTNLHGGFFVGIFLVCCCAAGELALWLVEKDRNAAKTALLRSRPYLMTAIACGAVTFVNPYFFRLHSHVWHYLSSPGLWRNISEFQGPNFRSPLAFWFEGIVLLGVSAVVWSILRRRYDQAIFLAVWLHLALLAVRNIPVYLIVAAPAVAGMLHDTVARIAEAPLAAWVRKQVLGFHNLAAEIGGLDGYRRVHLTSILGFGLVAAGFYLPAPPAKLRAEYKPERYPAKALDVIRGPEFAQSIFTEDEWGDYLIYRLYPQTRVFVDGRSDLYGEQFTEKYVALIRGKYGWEETLLKYGVDTVLLPVDAPLTGILKECRRWRPVYDDGMAIVFRSEAALDKSDSATLADRDEGLLAPSVSRGQQASAVTTEGRDKGDHAVTNINHRASTSLAKSNTRSESTCCGTF